MKRPSMMACRTSFTRMLLQNHNAQDEREVPQRLRKGVPELRDPRGVSGTSDQSRPVDPLTVIINFDFSTSGSTIQVLCYYHYYLDDVKINVICHYFFHPSQRSKSSVSNPKRSNMRSTV